jgi:hypothetical protein
MMIITGINIISITGLGEFDGISNKNDKFFL